MKFRGKPRDRQSSSFTRPFKKPRKTGSDKVLPTIAMDPQLETEEPISQKEVIADALATIQTIDSEYSKDDNIPIAQTRLKKCGTVINSDSEEGFTPLSETIVYNHYTKVRIGRHMD
jgi:hypothetical protein